MTKTCCRADHGRFTGEVVEERLVDEARSALGHDGGRIADPVWRSRVAAHEMNRHAYRLAQRRAVEESEGGTPGPPAGPRSWPGRSVNSKTV
ncbi:MAG: hypothetical protein OXU72_18655, partial [Gammaproteobacteria bacterium]|nr:hypothetical protein [Gammaproteobacteria bacterium]